MKRAFLIDLIHNTNLWCIVFQYIIWKLIISDQITRQYVPYFLWHNLRPHYKHINSWVTMLYVINVQVTKNKFYHQYPPCFLMGYDSTA